MSKVKNLAEAKNIISIYLKSLLPNDRRDFWNDDDKHPYDKIVDMVKELMPDYQISFYIDHQEGDEDLISDVLYNVIDEVNGKKVISFDVEDFWFDEVGHDRFYITAIKTE